jgi:hypothetical protein
MLHHYSKTEQYKIFLNRQKEKIMKIPFGRVVASILIILVWPILSIFGSGALRGGVVLSDVTGAFKSLPLNIVSGIVIFLFWSVSVSLLQRILVAVGYLLAIPFTFGSILLFGRLGFPEFFGILIIAATPIAGCLIGFIVGRLLSRYQSRSST